MSRNTLIGAAIALSFATASPALAQNAGQVAKGGLLGAGAGAIAGAVIPGVSVGTGALIGAAGGTAITVINHHKHRYHRDRQGRRYWVDRSGQRHYR